jgi:DNA helicase IV
VPHPDVVHEQAYVDDAYRCLEAMRERTARVADIADSAAQAVDSAVAQAHLHHRLTTLDTDVPGLAFGRLDEDPVLADTPTRHDGEANRAHGPSGAHGRGRRGDDEVRRGETWYVGRRHVEDAQGDPVVVDWRSRSTGPPPPTPWASSAGAGS